jgi:hypothetical protein
MAFVVARPLIRVNTRSRSRFDESSICLKTVWIRMLVASEAIVIVCVRCLAVTFAVFPNPSGTEMAEELTKKWQAATNDDKVCLNASLCVCQFYCRTSH